MKKWIKFFGYGFFSHRWSKEGTKRGYVSFILSLILALLFLWIGFVGGDLLPFSAHYQSSPSFLATVHSVFANENIDKRIEAEIENGVLKATRHDAEHGEGVLVNTFENAADKQTYSVNGYNVVIDTRSADTLAEIEAYCISNDGQNLMISYEEYLSLSSVAKLNFDFELKYTGNELKLNDELVESYKVYLENQGDENKTSIESLENELSQNKITRNEYNRAVYELYFASYYSDISNYESSSKVPLLRNYYYHQYINKGADKYLFVFDDYMAGCFETENGIISSFYGFYSDLENGALVLNNASQAEANSQVDNFVKASFNSTAFLSLYVYGLNIFSLIPFIALMPMVITLLAYSILKLRGVESITSLGAMFKIIGSYVWMSGLISAVLTMISAFFVQKNIMTALPLVFFFIVLAVRSIIFAVTETKIYLKQLEQLEVERTEV